MATLYLPLAHTDADLVLAGQIAERIDSGELYVAWTPAAGRAVPEVVAELRAAVPRWTGTIALVFQAVRELWAAICGRAPQQRALPPAVEQAAAPKPAA
jgi:hypothetical protein